MMKKAKKSVEDQSVYTKKTNQQYSNMISDEVLSESKNVSNCTEQFSPSEYSQLTKPPQFQYVNKKYAEEEETSKEKIQVNEKLKNLLLDD